MVFRRESWTLTAVEIAVIFSSMFGCVSSTTYVTLLRGELPQPPESRSGTVRVEKFIDLRSAGPDGASIGQKRNTYGTPLGRVAARNVSIDTLVTGFIADALVNTGYTVLPAWRMEPAAADTASVAVLSGRIVSFWSDAYVVANAKVKVELELKNPEKNSVVWRTAIEGDRVAPVPFYTSDEYQYLFEGAFQYLIDTAQQKFSTEEFMNKVNYRK